MEKIKYLLRIRELQRVVFGYKSKEYEKANNALKRVRQKLKPVAKSKKLRKKEADEMCELFPSTIGYLYRLLNRVRSRYGCRSRAYIKVASQIGNMLSSSLESTQGTLEFARDTLLPLSCKILKLERDKMLQDEKKELARALRPYAVEAVINDEHQIDFDALREITREKINADRE